MSFLRKMFGGNVTTDDPRRFLIEAMLGAMEADGDMTDEELSVLDRNLEVHQLFAGIKPEARARLIEMAADAVREAGGGIPRCAAIAKGLPGRVHRQAAYAMACEVCVADADLPESEIRYLEALQAALELSNSDARELFEGARAESGLMTLEERTAAMRAMMPSFVDCMALMAGADGEIDDDELIGVRGVLRNIPDMSVLEDDELDAAIADAFSRLEGKPAEQELGKIAQTITGGADRYWTAVYMMIIALADGKADWREVALLKTAQTMFDLSEHQMDQAMATAALFPAIELGGAAPGA